MAKRTFVAFVIDPELKRGLEFVKKRDGISVSFQVHRAIEAWLKARGVAVPKKEGATSRER
jgi:hypothetical protein